MLSVRVSPSHLPQLNRLSVAGRRLEVSICHKNRLFRGSPFCGRLLNSAGRGALPRCSPHPVRPAAAGPRILRRCLKFQPSSPDDHSRFCPETCMVPPSKAPLNTFSPNFVHGRFLTRRAGKHFTALTASCRLLETVIGKCTC